MPPRCRRYRAVGHGSTTRNSTKHLCFVDVAGCARRSSWLSQLNKTSVLLQFPGCSVDDRWCSGDRCSFAILDSRTLFRQYHTQKGTMGLQNTLHQSAAAAKLTARCKVYPNGMREWLVCDQPIFGSGWETPLIGKNPRKKKAEDEDGGGERAKRRARAAVRDLALCNDFRYFVTLTLDERVIDRYDMAAITRKLNTWLDNNVRRRGLAYVLVPEHHKDGAIHFHGLFNDVLPVVDSGHTDTGGHRIYNLPRWGFGFSTAIELYGDYDKAVGYVCKYIGKGDEKIGGRWYFSGGELHRPEVEYYDLHIRDAEQMENCYQFSIPEAGLCFAQFRTYEEERGE